MTRIPPAPVEQYGPLFGTDAPLRQQVYAQAPAAATAYMQYQKALRENGTLPRRLVELVRLRVSFHNQCRTCMSIRYSDAGAGSIDDGVTEALVCSLERPQEADDLTDAEKVALAFADKLATDHLSIDDEMFARLYDHFEVAQVMELCFQVATFVGFGRMVAVLAITDDLPEEYGDPDAVLAPWRQAPQEVV
jgi:AhpD family alkylhydroperoxidase